MALNGHQRTDSSGKRGRGLRSGFTERSLRETAPEVGLLGPLPMRRQRSNMEGRRPVQGVPSLVARRF
jgi:hypothetical protein